MFTIKVEEMYKFCIHRGLYTMQNCLQTGGGFFVYAIHLREWEEK